MVVDGQDDKEQAYRQLKQEEGEEVAAEPLNNKALREVNERLTPRGMMRNERRSSSRD